MKHAVRGEGTVMEHLEDGRTLVEFDSGESHRYYARSLHKLSSTKSPPTVAPTSGHEKDRALPGPSAVGSSTSAAARELDRRFEAVLGTLELPEGAAENMRTNDDAKKRQLI